MISRAEAQEVLNRLPEWPAVLVEMGAPLVFVVIANLQLALRHPGNVGESARTAREFVDLLVATLPDECQPIIAAGWDEAHDR
jgi:hypothetical protein